MTISTWAKAPIGIDAERWISRPVRRTVLAVAHSMVSCQRLLDVIGLIEGDTRIQVVFTVGPDVFNHRVAGYLERLDALVLPWQQAVRERFDLAVAAAHGGLRHLRAPLLVMAHGAGHAKPVRSVPDGLPPGADPPVYGLDAQRLLHDGRVLATALALAHDHELDVLRRQCPPALDAAVVVGDPCLDRLVASLSRRRAYRHALDVDDDQRLVVVSSTWGRDGLFGRHPDLLPTALADLPARRFRVAALLHPAVWDAHGHRQVRAWLRDCLAAGLPGGRPAPARPDRGLAQPRRRRRPRRRRPWVRSRVRRGDRPADAAPAGPAGPAGQPGHGRGGHASAPGGCRGQPPGSAPATGPPTRHGAADRPPGGGRRSSRPARHPRLTEPVPVPCPAAWQAAR
ncbi:hypothetical protein AWW66_22105 [Micromonospora rosaria]|uniref:Uncharacterized protein n=1 Tax=Micromonospora rosaria TaxID=47874 RepID=A0A136PN30_9ACTN|nr:hypothetical protein [Micromonospora rosaria]KXK59825.1 hypothetical protein AWW66_22105 [Micromonospora rosaria]